MFLEDMAHFIPHTLLLLMIFDHFPNSNLRPKSQAGRLWNLSPHSPPGLTQVIRPLRGCCFLTSQPNRLPPKDAGAKMTILGICSERGCDTHPSVVCSKWLTSARVSKRLWKAIYRRKWNLTLEDRDQTWWQVPIEVSSPRTWGKYQEQNPRNISCSDNSYSRGDA